MKNIIFTFIYSLSCQNLGIMTLFLYEITLYLILIAIVNLLMTFFLLCYRGTGINFDLFFHNMHLTELLPNILINMCVHNMQYILHTRVYMNIYFEVKSRTQLRQRFILSRAFVSISYQLFQGEDFGEKTASYTKW